jgi:hypothetical protein
MQKTEIVKQDLRFSDYIKKLPTQWVFENFLNKSIASRRILSSSAIYDRIKLFVQPDSLAALYGALGPGVRTKCALTYLMGKTGLTADDSHVDLNDDLIRSFLVYALRNKRGEVRYFGFSEFEHILRPFFASTIAAAAAPKGKTAVPAPERHGNCANDIAMTATLASQGFLEKKKQGDLTQSALQKIGKLTHELSPSHQHDGIAGMLVDYCVHSEIVHETETGYHQAPESFEAWLHRKADERSAEILRFAVEYSGSWRIDLLHGIVASADGGWLSCTVFPEGSRKEAIDTLRILNWAGVVALSRMGTDTVFGASKDEGSATDGHDSKMSGGAILMPDFTVVLSPGSSPEQLYRFGKLGTLQSLDRVYKGAVDRGILNDSLSSGLEGASILAWLAEWAAPPNVVATVREWIREFYRLYVSTGPMLVTTDEKVSFQIASFGPLKEYLEPVPSHAVFKIKQGAEEKVREFLGQMGFDHRMPDRDHNSRGQTAFPSHEAATEAVAGVAPDSWEPIVELASSATAGPLVLRGKKYGAGLKALDLNEIMHIIDYAILTGTELVLDYAGSPFIKKGEYTVVPRSCNKGADPQLDATLKSGLKKQFHVRKISKIGVGVS